MHLQSRHCAALPQRQAGLHQRYLSLRHACKQPLHALERLEHETHTQHAGGHLTQ